VPNVTDAEATRCVDSPEGQAMLPDIYLLDGSTLDCVWGNSPDAITPGIFGPSTNPTNPNSPHHGDQTKLFARKQWVTDRFSAHDIAADPQLTTTVLTGR
jgi:hypothetical protein